MTDNPQPDRIPIGRNVTYAVRGMPEVANQYGPGFLVPTEVSLTYRSTEDSQLGRFHAYVKGHWRHDGDEAATGLPLPGQHYYGDPAGWPDWLAAEARLHDPDAAVPSAPADRAAILREAAEAVVQWSGQQIGVHVPTVDAAAALLRRMADEAQQPGKEASAPEVVAYRDPNSPKTLLCRDHGERWQGVVPVTAEELPDGGICTFRRLSSLECGRDVLIPQQPAAVSQPGKEA